MTTEKTERRQFWMLSAYYFVIYMSGGSFFAYIALYYAEIGLSNAQVGLIGSLGAVVTIAAQPVWGTLADRAKTKNRVICIAILGSAAAVWLMPLADSTIAGLFAAFAVFTVFQCAPHPLSDAMALEICQKRRFNFSTIRTMGSLGYALLAFVAGQIFVRDIMLIFPVYSGLLFAALLIALPLPKVEGHQRKSEKKRFFDVLKDRKIILMYVYALVIQSTLGFGIAFHAIYSAEFGIETNVLGIGIMLGSFSQFPFMLLFPKIIKRVPVTYILGIAGLTQALRWLMYAFALNHVTIYFIWALHGFGFIVFYLCFAEIVSKKVPPGLRASGQAMNALILGGLSRIIGSALGGIGGELIGLGAMFAVCGILCAAAAIIFLIVGQFKIKDDYNHLT